MFDCQNFHFSPELGRQRFQRAAQVIDDNVLNRLLAFALYLLGANRSDIARTAGRPLDSIKSLIKAIEKDGLAALDDRRRRDTSRTPAPAPQGGPWELFEEQGALVLRCGTPEKQLLIPRQNAQQKKVVLLSAVHSGLLTAADVAPWLGVTPTHTRNLARKLTQEDAGGAGQEAGAAAGVSRHAGSQSGIDPAVCPGRRPAGQDFRETDGRASGRTLSTRIVREDRPRPCPQVGAGTDRRIFAGAVNRSKKNSRA